MYAIQSSESRSYSNYFNNQDVRQQMSKTSSHLVPFSENQQPMIPVEPVAFGTYASSDNDDSNPPVCNTFYSNGQTQQQQQEEGDHDDVSDNLDFNDIMVGMKHTLLGIAYDLRFWNVLPVQDDKWKYVFLRDNRALFVFIWILLILFIVMLVCKLKEVRSGSNSCTGGYCVPVYRK